MKSLAGTREIPFAEAEMRATKLQHFWRKGRALPPGGQAWG